MCVEYRIIPTTIISFKVDVYVFNQEPTVDQIISSRDGTCASNLE